MLQVDEEITDIERLREFLPEYKGPNANQDLAPENGNPLIFRQNDWAFQAGPPVFVPSSQSEISLTH